MRVEQLRAVLDRLPDPKGYPEAVIRCRYTEPQPIIPIDDQSRYVAAIPVGTLTFIKVRYDGTSHWELARWTQP